MSVETTKALKLFYCYARADKALRDELDLHLTSLKRQNLITSWYDGEIVPGDAWEEEIDRELKSAHLILLLITPHFIASEYCYSIEMKRALERHKVGTARVIPIILRHTFWQHAPFSMIQALPTDAKPISEWVDRDKAFLDITVGIHKTILELQATLLTPQELVSKGIALHNLKRFEEALAVYEQAIRLAPNHAVAYINKGATLCNLKRFEDALAACNQAIQLNPNHAEAYNNKGEALSALKRHEEALDAYNQAIRLNPNHASAYINRGEALNALKRHEEALDACNQAIRLDPNYAEAYNNKGHALDALKRFEDALTAYDQAIQLDPNYANAYHNKGIVLTNLGRSREAQRCYEKARELGYP